jgi:hypothetical protein
MWARCILFAFVVALLSGCSDNPRGPRVRPGDPEPEVEPGLTDDECRELAEKIAKAVQSQDATALAALFDWDALLQNATGDIQVPARETQRFVTDMRGDGKRVGVLGQQIIDLVARGGTYKYLHTHVVEHRQRLQFRLALPDGQGLNYHDVVLSRRPPEGQSPKGKIKAIDVYIFTNGELLSQTARRAFLTAMLRQAQIPAARLQGAELEFHLHFKKVELMNELARAGKHAEVLKLYDQLPPELQRDKNVLLTRLRAAQAVGGAEYSEAIENFRAFHPNDPCVDLFAITYYVQKREFKQALAMIDHIEGAVGPDAYLDVLRANVHLEAGDPAAARKAAEAALTAEPMLADAHWALVGVSLQEKKHGETLDRLREIERRLAPKFPDFASLPDYADFVKSPQYQEWIKSHKSP